MPTSFSSVADAMTAFMRILGSAKDSLRKVLLTGEYDDEFVDEGEIMHCTARLAEMLNGYSDELQNSSRNPEGLFLLEEVKALQESKGIWLPGFLPRSVFLALLHRKVKRISPTPEAFVGRVWDYLEGVVIRVMIHHCEDYPQLHAMMRRASESVISRMKTQGMGRMKEMLEMEKMADYTCNPEYMSAWNKLKSYQQEFTVTMDGKAKSWVVKIDGFGEVDMRHLGLYKGGEAFDMKMRITAYWRVVLRRLVDSIALHLVFSLQSLVNEEVEAAVVHELMRSRGGGIQRMLEESPSVANKRDKLTRSIGLLRESKEVLSKIMDFID